MTAQEMMVQRAIFAALSTEVLTIKEFVNQHEFHRRDMIDLNAARKDRIWITEPPKSKCTEKCKFIEGAQ